MVSKIKDMAVGFVLFGILIGMIVFIQSGIQKSYDLEDLDKKIYNGKNVTIGDALNNLGIVIGFNESIEAIYDIQAPEGSGITDLLGALATAAIGAVKIIINVVTVPFEIIAILHTFYNIPPLLTAGLFIIMIISIGFIILKLIAGGGDI